MDSEARNAAIVGASLDRIVTFDRRGKIVDFNPAAEQTFQYSRARALGLDLVSLIIAPGLRDEYGRQLARDMAIGRRRIEDTARRADGTDFPAEFVLVIRSGRHRRASLRPGDGLAQEVTRVADAEQRQHAVADVG